MGNSPHLTASAPHPFVSTMVPHSLARIASVICTVDAAPWLIDFGPPGILDRKSTRLNSSHVKISYAVFCLTNKNKQHLPSHEKNWIKNTTENHCNTTTS